ncbi:flavoprotein [Embleya hyalina]|uniref:Flavoprotein n=1 Tax=Embleya hyalina TaxID=516124 RepID=A0A401YTQ5_9ACTN|nr:flavoprotein [Embleya hyalina]GCD97987.1 flavoprotein [Embleya hyalina]
MTNRVLYVVAGAAPPVRDLVNLVRLLREDGWDTCVTLTPTAAAWLGAGLDDPTALAGRPVRTRERHPDDPRPFPAPDALLACPLTFNSLNKWALGISDNVALGTLNEALGAGIPVVAVPWFRGVLAAHPASTRSLDTLRACGVDLVLDEDGAPFDGDEARDWATVISRLPTLDPGA